VDTNAHRLLPGTCLGPYTVDSELSRSAHSVVYLVQHSRRHSWWALKVFPEAGARMTERLEREALIRDALRHPNIVPAVELLDARGVPGLVMEFVEGGTLRHQLDEWGALPLGSALDLVRGISAAVAHAHAYDVIHRDLRPENVLLQPIGPKQVLPRVVDWGLAKIRDPTGPYGGLTTVQRSLGTPGYAAPEQIRDASSASPASDVFALGVLLYELVAGEAPFAGKSELGAALAARKREFPPLDERCPEAPQELVALVHRMLDPDPGQRPADAAEVLDLLPQVDAAPVPVTEEVVARSAASWIALLASLPLAAAIMGIVVAAAAR